MPLALNLVAYQCAWLACVLGAAHRLPALGLAVAGAALLLHLSLALAPGRELALAGVTASAGGLFESALLASGWVRASDPLLMIALWAVFATTLNVALRPLRGRYLLCMVVAAVGAPLAYHAGARLGALNLLDPVPALAMISFGWALLLPLLMHAAQRFDGVARS
jgi:hypothetical protein